ncbi:MAG: hypothetical protein K0U36_01665, partial [Alphaproteobacteria bacterium]|nr:hypothetical protein [Alphaproteobacteria bacterium]
RSKPPSVCFATTTRLLALPFSQSDRKGHLAAPYCNAAAGQSKEEEEKRGGGHEACLQESTVRLRQ